MKISTLAIQGSDVDFTYNNGALAYTFENGGKRYGNSVKLDKKGISDVMAATALLINNYLETKSALHE